MPQQDISLHLIEDAKVLCKNRKIMIPTSLRHRVVSWYHHYLQHPGHLHLEEKMRSVMYWKGMGTTIWICVKTCWSWQVNKRHSHKYGHLPPKLVITTPWKALCVDLIGPYTLKGKDGSSIDFMCSTMINPTTSWFKIGKLPTVAQETTVPPVGKGKKVTFAKNTKVAEPYFDKSSAQIRNLVYKIWFSRYPRCWYIIYDNGSKFKLHFQSLYNTYGIKHKPTSVKNPQANAILERIHAILGNKLRTSKLNMAEMVKANDIDIFLSDAAWAVCSTYHIVLKASPVAAIFGWDILFVILFIADSQKIGEHRQELTDLNVHENKGRSDYDYKVGQKLLLRKEGILGNAESRWHKKLWLLTSVHTDGTTTVQRGNKIDRMNIWRIKPLEII